MDFKQIQQEICNTISSQKQNTVQNSEIVETINLLAGYLNAETVGDFSRRHAKDYTGAKYLIKKNNLQTFELFGQKLVIDNE